MVTESTIAPMSSSRRSRRFAFGVMPGARGSRSLRRRRCVDRSLDEGREDLGAKYERAARFIGGAIPVLAEVWNDDREICSDTLLLSYECAGGKTATALTQFLRPSTGGRAAHAARPG